MPGSQTVAARSTLALTGGFRLLVDGEPVAIGQSGARLLAYLALAGRQVLRSRAAADLWQDSSPSRATSNLRATLWRIPEPCGALVTRRGSDLGIAPGLRVDVTELLRSASGVVDQPIDVQGAHRLARLTELLPGWSDTWVLLERERLRLRCLGALEMASTAWARGGMPAESLAFAAEAVRIEPLRESAWRLVVEAHRDQGNLAAVVGAYSDYCTLLRRELGIGPSLLMERLIDQCGVRRGCARAPAP